MLTNIERYLTNIDKPFIKAELFRKACFKNKKPAGRRKQDVGIPILSIHVNSDTNINMHIDIHMNIDITPHTPTPCRGRPQTGPGGGGMELGGWGGININLDINIDIDIHIIININIEYYIDYQTLPMSNSLEQIKINKKRLIRHFTHAFEMS